MLEFWYGESRVGKADGNERRSKAFAAIATSGEVRLHFLHVSQSDHPLQMSGAARRRG